MQAQWPTHKSHGGILPCEESSTSTSVIRRRRRVHFSARRPIVGENFKILDSGSIRVPLFFGWNPSYSTRHHLSKLRRCDAAYGSVIYKPKPSASLEVWRCQRWAPDHIQCNALPGASTDNHFVSVCSAGIYSFYYVRIVLGKEYVPVSTIVLV